MRKKLFHDIAMIASCVLAAACVNKDHLIVWKSELRSPNGAWIATAETVQNGGFGSGDIYTAVYLNTATSSRPAIEVLGFDCQGPVPRPYVRDNVANRGGTIGLAMKWITPSHLLVTYKGHPDIRFQAVQLDGIEITLQDLASHAGGH